jgi:hypothetical protein
MSILFRTSNKIALNESVKHVEITGLVSNFVITEVCFPSKEMEYFLTKKDLIISTKIGSDRIVFMFSRFETKDVPYKKIRVIKMSIIILFVFKFDKNESFKMSGTMNNNNNNNNIGSKSFHISIKKMHDNSLSII